MIHAMIGWACAAFALFVIWLPVLLILHMHLQTTLTYRRLTADDEAELENRRKSHTLEAELSHLSKEERGAFLRSMRGE